MIDLFTHSAGYDAVPVLRPFTERGFDGTSWITPWFMVADHVALVAVGAWLLAGRKRTVGS